MWSGYLPRQLWNSLDISDYISKEKRKKAMKSAQKFSLNYDSFHFQYHWQCKAINGWSIIVNIVNKLSLLACLSQIMKCLAYVSSMKILA